MDENALKDGSGVLEEVVVGRKQPLPSLLSLGGLEGASHSVVLRFIAKSENGQTTAAFVFSFLTLYFLTTSQKCVFEQ